MEVFDSALGRSRGILRLPSGGGSFEVSRRSPSQVLARCIAHYWMVGWDLRGRQPHQQETLPHPNVYVVFENHRLEIGGVSTSRFSRLLKGQAFAFGVKFRPGGFRPFLQSSVWALTNRIVAASSVFGADGDALEQRLIASRGEDEMIEAVEAFFFNRVPGPDQKLEMADRIVTQILQSPALRTVDGLVSHTGFPSGLSNAFFTNMSEFRRSGSSGGIACTN
jgi:hypothetical protein